MIFLVGFFWYLQALLPDSASVVAADINSLLTLKQQNQSTFNLKTGSGRIESFLNPGESIQFRNKVENWDDNENNIKMD